MSLCEGNLERDSYFALQPVATKIHEVIIFLYLYGYYVRTKQFRKTEKKLTSVVTYIEDKSLSDLTCKKKIKSLISILTFKL